MKTWAVINQKGGVGKTTTAISLAGHLCDTDKRLLLVDLDPHGSLTSYLGYDPDQMETGLYSLFSKPTTNPSEIAKMLLPIYSRRRQHWRH
jgi:chromosome partitioning protein